MQPVAPTHFFFGPDSMAWRVCRERAVMAMAPRAVILQYAHPAFAAASAVYSSRDANPGARFERALSALSIMVFADRATADRHAARIARLHAPLQGAHEDGRAWSANDPEALSWVLVTLLDAALRGAELVQGRFTDGEVRAYLDEAARFGALFGVREGDVPRTRAQLEARIDDEVREVLVVGAETRAMWSFLTTPEPDAPLDQRVRAAVIARWSAATLPPAICDGLGVARPHVQRWNAAARALGALLRHAPAEQRFTERYRAAMQRAEDARG